MRHMLRATRWFSSVVLLCLLILPAHPSVAKEYVRFDVVGDSDSEGINPDYSEMYGWVHMLFGEGGGDLPEASTRTLQSLWPGIEMHNSAVSGSTAAQWQNDLVAPNLQDVIDRHPDLVVVMIGGNDFLAYFLADGEFSTSEQNLYKTHLTTIIDRLQGGTPKPDIIVLNYYDLADQQSSILQYVPGYSQYAGLSSNVVTAVGIIQEVAQSKGCHYVDIYNDFMYHCYGVDVNPFARHDDPDYVKRPLNLTDLSSGDIHPNTNGYREIHQNVYDQLKILKAIPEPQTWFAATQKIYISTTGHFYAMVYNFGSNSVDDTLDSQADGSVEYAPAAGNWVGAYLYDYDTGGYVRAMHVYKESLD